jgi:hypothetical protein
MDEKSGGKFHEIRNHENKPPGEEWWFIHRMVYFHGFKKLQASWDRVN